MNITSKIDEFLSRNKKKLIKEQSEVSDLNADVMELLNSLDDDYLDEDQIALKDRIISSNFTIIENDIDELPVDDYIMEPETDDVSDGPLSPESPEAIPEIGDEDLYGYDENDITIADNKKLYKRKPLIFEGKTKKSKKPTKKSK